MHRHEALPKIAESIAEVDGCPTHELGYSLHEHIDTEALVSLVSAEQRNWKLAFTVPDHTVEIRGDGQRRVDYAIVGELEEPAE